MSTKFHRDTLTIQEIIEFHQKEAIKYEEKAYKNREICAALTLSMQYNCKHFWQSDAGDYDDCTRYVCKKCNAYR